MKKKVLILGAAGMAGFVIKRRLESADRWQVDTVTRSDQLFKPTYKVDLSDFNQLRKILDNNYDVVINAVGLLNQYAEDHPDEAILINSYLPHFLAQYGLVKDFRLIHISTDCVFNGKKGDYRVTDPQDGIGYYAQTKALGEVPYAPHLTIRTSIIGPELKSNGIGLFHWFMNQTGAINGFKKAFWSGVTTNILADVIASVIENPIEGLYQLTNNQKISKYDLLQLFKEVFQRDQVIVNPVEGKAVDKSLINERSDFDFLVPDYRSMIQNMKQQMLLEEHLYKQYFS